MIQKSVLIVVGLKQPNGDVVLTARKRIFSFFGGLIVTICSLCNPCGLRFARSVAKLNGRSGAKITGIQLAKNLNVPEPSRKVPPIRGSAGKRVIEEDMQMAPQDMFKMSDIKKEE